MASLVDPVNLFVYDTRKKLSSSLVAPRTKSVAVFANIKVNSSRLVVKHLLDCTMSTQRKSGLKHGENWVPLKNRNKRSGPKKLNIEAASGKQKAQRDSCQVELLPGTSLKVCSCGTVAGTTRSKKCRNCHKFFYDHWAQQCKTPCCPKCNSSRKVSRREHSQFKCIRCGFEDFEIAEKATEQKNNHTSISDPPKLLPTVLNIFKICDNQSGIPEEPSGGASSIPDESALGLFVKPKQLKGNDAMLCFGEEGKEKNSGTPYPKTSVSNSVEDGSPQNSNSSVTVLPSCSDTSTQASTVNMQIPLPVIAVPPPVSFGTIDSCDMSKQIVLYDQEQRASPSNLPSFGKHCCDEGNDSVLDKNAQFVRMTCIPLTLDQPECDDNLQMLHESRLAAQNEVECPANVEQCSSSNCRFSNVEHPLTMDNLLQSGGTSFSEGNKTHGQNLLSDVFPKSQNEVICPVTSHGDIENHSKVDSEYVCAYNEAHSPTKSLDLFDFLNEDLESSQYEKKQDGFSSSEDHLLIQRCVSTQNQLSVPNRAHASNMCTSFASTETPTLHFPITFPSNFNGIAVSNEHTASNPLSTSATSFASTETPTLHFPITVPSKNFNSITVNTALISSPLSTSATSFASTETPTLHFPITVPSKNFNSITVSNEHTALTSNPLSTPAVVTTLLLNQVPTEQKVRVPSLNKIKKLVGMTLKRPSTPVPQYQKLQQKMLADQIQTQIEIQRSILKSQDSSEPSTSLGKTKSTSDEEVPSPKKPKNVFSDIVADVIKSIKDLDKSKAKVASTVQPVQGLSTPLSTPMIAGPCSILLPYNDNSQKQFSTQLSVNLPPSLPTNPVQSLLLDPKIALSENVTSTNPTFRKIEMTGTNKIRVSLLSQNSVSAERDTLSSKKQQILLPLQDFGSVNSKLLCKSESFTKPPGAVSTGNPVSGCCAPSLCSKRKEPAGILYQESHAEKLMIIDPQVKNPNLAVQTLRSVPPLLKMTDMDESSNNMWSETSQNEIVSPPIFLPDSALPTTNSSTSELLTQSVITSTLSLVKPLSSDLSPITVVPMSRQSQYHSIRPKHTASIGGVLVQSLQPTSPPPLPKVGSVFVSVLGSSAPLIKNQNAKSHYSTVGKYLYCNSVYPIPLCA